MVDKIVGKLTRQEVQAKIKNALAKKPTQAMLNNGGIPVEQLNKMVSNNYQPSDPPQPFQRVVRNNKRNAGKGGIRRPQSALPFASGFTEISAISNEPSYSPEIYLYETPEGFELKSIPKVSIIIPLYKSNVVIEDQINNWVEDVGCEKIYFDDMCPNDSKKVVLDTWVKKGLGDGVGKIVCAKSNSGYGLACNSAVKHASGEFLIFLNADTKVTKNWIKPMMDLFDDPKVGIVGNLQLKMGTLEGTIDSAGSEFSWHNQTFDHIGRHVYKGSHLSTPFSLENMPEDLKVIGEREMVTGCCFMMRKKLFDYIGGFDPHYRIGYYEDSDLCLRVRELGYKILFTPFSKIHHSLSHSGQGGHKYMRSNQEFFRNRWINSGRIDPLLFKPRPEGKPQVRNILVIRDAAVGDTLVAASVCSALKKRHLGCHITFYSKNCYLALQNNPHIDLVVNQKPSKAFDFQVNLDLAYEYFPNKHIIRAFAEEANIPIEDCKLFCAKQQMSVILPQSFFCVHAKGSGYGWTGRNWRENRWAELSSKISKEYGMKAVSIGNSNDFLMPDSIDLRGKTTLQNLAWLLSQSKFLIGVDSAPMWIAQCLGSECPYGVIFFGSILPQHRLVGNRLHSISETSLDCLGCHHDNRIPSLGTSVCKRGDLACEESITVDKYWTKVKEVYEKKILYLPII